MGASTAETPAAPDEQPAPGLRASDADRDQVVARLRDEYVAGRLSQDTFLHRVDLVLERRRRAELPPVLADLPARPASPAGPAARGLARVPALGRPAARRVRRPAASAPRRGRPPTASGPRPPAWRPPRRRAAAAAAVPAQRRAASSASAGTPACDLAIADLTVSRRHAQLERTADGWLLTDLESTNGTRVNGWRVRGQTVPVSPGDRVMFGDQEVVFLPAGTPRPPCPSRTFR